MEVSRSPLESLRQAHPMNLMDCLFRHRSTALLVLIAPILVGALRPTTPPHPAEVAAGAALALIGAGLRVLAARALGRGARVHRAGVRGALVRWGPYRWSRNPLYLAAASLFTGAALTVGLGPWSALVGLGCLTLYLPVVLHEESAISSSSPDYATYRAQVSRWLGWPGPRVQPPEAPPSWGAVWAREWRLIPGVLGAGVGILALRSLAEPARALAETHGVPWELTAVCAVILAGAVNSWTIERKRRRHEARRSAQAKAQAEQGAAAHEGLGDRGRPEDRALRPQGAGV